MHLISGTNATSAGTCGLPPCSREVWEMGVRAIGAQPARGFQGRIRSSLAGCTAL